MGFADNSAESSLGFVYGVPGLLLGLALRYAQLEPCPVETTDQAIAARESLSTETLQKVYKDVTRHRYGDEAHMEEALRALRLVASGRGPPTLIKMRESIETDPAGSSQYSLAMIF